MLLACSTLTLVFLYLQVEKELKATLSEWENDHERYFIIKDSRYLDTIESQWKEKNEIKEKEKLKRVSCRNP